MIHPVRLQLSRRKGFSLQAHSRAVNGLLAVNVAWPFPGGNPFVVGQDGDRQECVYMHARLLASYVCMSSKATVEAQKAHIKWVRDSRSRLKGQNIACWCRLCPRHKLTGLPIGNGCTDCGPCHGMTLLAVFNG